MANQELYGKTYNVPPEVLKYIQTVLVSNPTGEGVKRAKFIVKNGVLTYQELKGLKHFFDTFNPQAGSQAQYALAGGDAMKVFIERKLQSERDAVKRGEKIKQDMTVDPNLGTKPYQTPRLNEEKKKGDLKKNAVAIIVNGDNKILLLKRSDDPKQWMPSKWALVGGAIDKGETPEEAIKREIKEETGLEINKFVNTFTIKRHKDSIETMFACRYDGDPTDIKLNEENTNYGWYDIEEINYLEIVPHLMEYITLAFKKYE
jgi:8-oxo-dGTP diphosphatase